MNKLPVRLAPRAIAEIIFWIFVALGALLIVTGCATDGIIVPVATAPVLMADEAKGKSK